MDIRNWLKKIEDDMIKNGFGQFTLKTGCISRKNKWNKLIFGVLIQIQES